MVEKWGNVGISRANVAGWQRAPGSGSWRPWRSPEGQVPARRGAGASSGRGRGSGALLEGSAALSRPPGGAAVGPSSPEYSLLAGSSICSVAPAVNPCPLPAARLRLLGPQFCEGKMAGKKGGKTERNKNSGKIVPETPQNFQKKPQKLLKHSPKMPRAARRAESHAWRFRAARRLRAAFGGPAGAPRPPRGPAPQEPRPEDGERPAPGARAAPQPPPGPALLPSAPQDLRPVLALRRLAPPPSRRPLRPRGPRSSPAASLARPPSPAAASRAAPSSPPAKELPDVLPRTAAFRRLFFRGAAWKPWPASGAVAGLEPGSSCRCRPGACSRRVSGRPEQSPGPVQNSRASPASPTSTQDFWAPPALSALPSQGFRRFRKETDAGKEQGLRSSRRRRRGHDPHGQGAPRRGTVTAIGHVPSAAPQNVSLEVVNSKGSGPRRPLGARGAVPGAHGARRRRSAAGGDARTPGGLGPLLAGGQRPRNPENPASPEGTNGAPTKPRPSPKLPKPPQRGPQRGGNGTAPPSGPAEPDAPHGDTDDARVPERPGSLRARPLPAGIALSWTPPAAGAPVRGFLIGYGVGSPYARSVRLHGARASYSILGLGKAQLAVRDLAESLQQRRRGSSALRERHHQGGRCTAARETGHGMGMGEREWMGMNGNEWE
ncbi:netrin receptor DCC [Motacilla alba alba]|uniref:netrin receptor DCC n=1 Tax=Motacilla alba alba TaxID=1094192 RepID=UPI0018D5317D|nr:netrin receptor DCC [Motacilla alba alba]